MGRGLLKLNLGAWAFEQPALKMSGLANYVKGLWVNCFGAWGSGFRGLGLIQGFGTVASMTSALPFSGIGNRHWGGGGRLCFVYILQSYHSCKGLASPLSLCCRFLEIGTVSTTDKPERV